MPTSEIAVEIPGHGTLHIAAALVDVNGTLAVDGRVAQPVRERLLALAGRLRLVIATADTFGTAKEELQIPGAELVILGPGSGSAQKDALLGALGPGTTVAIGNGYNDRRMIARAALGIAVLGREGACGETLRAARVVVADPVDALDLLLAPGRLTATLRD